MDGGKGVFSGGNGSGQHCWVPGNYNLRDAGISFLVSPGRGNSVSEILLFFIHQVWSCLENFDDMKTTLGWDNIHVNRFARQVLFYSTSSRLGAPAGVGLSEGQKA